MSTPDLFHAAALFARQLQALSVAGDAVQTAAFQSTEIRWRKMKADDQATWPPVGDYLSWQSGRVVCCSTRESTANSSGRVFSQEHWEAKWPIDGWWMPYPPPPPTEEAA